MIMLVMNLLELVWWWCYLLELFSIMKLLVLVVLSGIIEMVVVLSGISVVMIIVLTRIV